MTRQTQPPTFVDVEKSDHAWKFESPEDLGFTSSSSQIVRTAPNKELQGDGTPVLLSDRR